MVDYYKGERMFWSVYSQGVCEWDTLTDKEKLEFLQQFEHENSVLQGRSEREVVLFKSNDENASSYYCNHNPKQIFVHNDTSKNLRYTAPIMRFNDTFHEGYHAFIHDCATGKAEFKSIQNVNQARLFGNQYIADTVINGLMELDKEISSFLSYEEQCVRRESLLYFTYLTLKILQLHQLSNAYEKRFIIGYIHLLVEQNAYRTCVNTNPNKQPMDMLRHRLLNNEKFKQDFMDFELYAYPDMQDISPVTEEAKRRSESLYNEIPRAFIIELTDRLLKEEKKLVSPYDIDTITNELKVSADLMK